LRPLLQQVHGALSAWTALLSRSARPQPHAACPTPARLPKHAAQVRKKGHQSKLVQLYDVKGAPFGFLMIELEFTRNEAVRYIRVGAGQAACSAAGWRAAHTAVLTDMAWQPPAQSASCCGAWGPLLLLCPHLLLSPCPAGCGRASAGGPA
jgi:hypothetical protein